jgi:hypothetical protein
MIIQKIPKEFQPDYTSSYPPYSNGLNLEEEMFSRLQKEKETIDTDMIYLPIFWTSYYVRQDYGNNIEPLLQYLDDLDPTKKYFTIVQYAAGIFTRRPMPNLIVFCSGGGGVNTKSECIRHETFFGHTKQVFFGKTANYVLPLICDPPFPDRSLEKTCYCSFVGRFDTHRCRFEMKEALETIPNINLSLPYGRFDEYVDMTNKSLFTLAPRGYGYTSFRLFEAIVVGSIPIYIWEDKLLLPYQDKLDWSEFAILIKSDEIHDLPNRLEKCDVKKMQQRLKEVKTYFSHEYMTEYIKEKLTTRLAIKY